MTGLFLQATGLLSIRLIVIMTLKYGTFIPEETKQPQPEKLEVQSGPSTDTSADGESKPATSSFNNDIRPRRFTYKPSSRATFVGLAVVGSVLAINIGVIIFVMKGQDDEAKKLTVKLSR